MNEEDDKEFSELRRLNAEAPDTTLARLRRQLRLAQVGKDLIERQAWAFWVVLDTLLRLFFGSARGNRPAPQSEDKTNERLK